MQKDINGLNMTIAVGREVNPFPAFHDNCHLLCLRMYFGDYIANNMDPDQTAPLRAV